jgi:hypothetical protein
VDPPLASVARNEAPLREVNRQIERLSVEVGGGDRTPDGQIEFHCECGASCDERLHLTLEEYDAVHAQDDRFVVVPAHVSPEIERCVSVNERYAVVDKLPVAERLVGADGVPSSDGPG